MFKSILLNPQMTGKQYCITFSIQENRFLLCGQYMTYVENTKAVLRQSSKVKNKKKLYLNCEPKVFVVVFFSFFSMGLSMFPESPHQL